MSVTLVRVPRDRAIERTTDFRNYSSMHEMSFWEIVENSPEWFGAIANGLFALVTIGVVIWQAIVMRGQNKIMRKQNTIIRLQHEHEWLFRLNVERQQILQVTSKLLPVVGAIREKKRESDAHFWEQTQDIANELLARLNTLDVSAYSTEYGGWFPVLLEYVRAVLQAVSDDFESKATFDVLDPVPSPSTREALRVAYKQYNPTRALLDLESAIRMEHLDFKDRWKVALSA